MFGIIVLSAIAGKVYDRDLELGKRTCYFDDKPSACDFGIACGSLSLVVAVIFSVLDCAGAFQQDTHIRKFLHIVGSVVAAILAILWLSSFAYMYGLA